MVIGNTFGGSEMCRRVNAHMTILLLLRIIVILY